MSYHNHRVCFRLTLREAEMADKLIERIGTKNRTGLMRLALGVLSRLAKDKVGQADYSDALETWKSRDLLQPLLDAVRQSELQLSDKLRDPGAPSDKTPAKRPTKSTSKKASAAPT